MEATEQYRGGYCGYLNSVSSSRDWPCARIAEQNHFMHWELEFADLFADRGGFDLVIGNPSKIFIYGMNKMFLPPNPLFAIRDLSAAETAHQRPIALQT